MNATLTTDQQVSEFARAVRSQLSDLSPDEIDDLTDGLEADLSEHAHDSDLFTLGDPAAYASELRAAAGLPVRSSRRGSIARSISTEARRLQQLATAKIRSSKAASALLDFLVSLRPLWWIARALIGALVVYKVSDTGWRFGGAVIVTVTALLIISIQWGRGLWMPRPWLRVVRTVANILAVLVFPFAVSTGTSYISNYNSLASYNYVSSPDGLTLSGRQITNIFAYDSEGNPVSGVQLFDQDGKAVSTRLNSSWSYVENEGQMLVPTAKAAGGSGWNVFPLGAVPQSAFGATGRLKSTVTPSAVLFPFVKVRPLVSVAPSASASPTPSPSPSVDPSAIPSPSASPSP